MKRSDLLRLAAAKLWDGKRRRTMADEGNLCSAIKWAGRISGKRDMARRLHNEITKRLGGYANLNAWMCAHGPAPTDEQAQKHRKDWAEILAREFEAADS
jgi:hypothetical protein